MTKKEKKEMKKAKKAEEKAAAAAMNDFTKTPDKHPLFGKS